MYKREFEATLKTGNTPKSTFLYGACSYQNNALCEQLLSLLQANNDEKVMMYYDEYHFSTAKNFLSQSSLFGDRNILIIKSDKTIPAKELETLVELCAKNDSSYFIYQYFGEDKKATPLTKCFDKKTQAAFVRLFKAEFNEAMQLLQNHARLVGLNIDRYALQHLYMIHMEELSLCINECEKLLVLNKEIHIKDIDALVYGLGNVSMEHFLTKLLEKKDIKEEFERLIEGDGMEEIRMINAIEAHVVQLFLFHAYIKLHGSFDAKAILGYPLPPHIAAQRSQHSIKIDVYTYKLLLTLLSEAEYRLKKTSNLDKASYLLSTLIKLQSYL
ncbi:DNA polymerase III subunit delta [Sulfurospirillum barnesii]|uniref:DNA polymerase III, delta subunit n=1 Tax=Sulfurospirillum barnesii (strain ATCC 700032 / DSM 10660 / SES-3) TaxID=760154 RepID=I3XW98_SULBS|nr:DNA polymerase III subunit delta [Sulfurospirillum barnesii]AFL68222.1 DNA polymerase III, delta subunit [Sulfurospirillum barnesii SES-3]